MRKVAVIAAVCAAALAAVGSSSAAQFIARNATGVSIKTNAKGEALVTYHLGSRVRRVLLWGAINAKAPKKGTHQARFKVDYSGGWRTHHTTKFSGTCRRYDGPALPNVVAACTAPDGSYWAAQSWARPLPNLGFTPWAADLRQKWLEISHWRGEIAQIETGSYWLYGGRFQGVFGRLTYQGNPVYGFGTTRFGAPTDGFGTLVYLDTLNAPQYGPGWKRENSFVPHNPSGVFCYGFYTFDPTKGGYRHPPGYTARRGPGTGEKYRLTASGPGVTPNVEVVVPGLHAFDRKNPDDVALQQEQVSILQSWGDNGCRAGLS